MRRFPALGLTVLAFALGLAPAARAQSVAGEEMFDPAAVVAGIVVDRAACAQREREHTALWVEANGRGSCIRYYAAGLTAGANPIAAIWLNGDVLGPKGDNADKRQKGFGPALMIAQERRLAEAHGVPFVFIGRPGTYGSAGKHHAIRGRKAEADIVDAALDALKDRYGIGGFALGGHSGGGTLVAELLARRRDLRCAIISSGAPAYRAFLEARGLIKRGASLDRFDPATALDRIPRDPERRIFVIGDPREKNIPFVTQRLYFDGLVARGHAAWLVPLEKARDARFHGLVDFGEAATGLCASGRPTEEIIEILNRMPPQSDRKSN